MGGDSESVKSVVDSISISEVIGLVESIDSVGEEALFGNSETVVNTTGNSEIVGSVVDSIGVVVLLGN